MKTALITGITGQDGSYLAEFLLEKGYDVHGTIRRSSADFRERIAHLEVPYEEFDKWFRKTHQTVGWVEIENIPADEPTLKSSRRRGRKAEPEGIQVTIQTSDGLHLRKVGLDYQGLKALVEKLEGLCTSLLSWLIFNRYQIRLPIVSQKDV